MEFYCIVLLCLMLTCARAEISKEEALESFKVLSKECKEETQATDADMEAIINHEPSNSKEGKCLRACIMKKFHVMDTNGKFVKPQVMKMVEIFTQGDAAKMKLAEEVADACKDLEVSDDHCEAAAQYCSCVKKEASARGITSFKF